MSPEDDKLQTSYSIDGFKTTIYIFPETIICQETIRECYACMQHCSIRIHKMMFIICSAIRMCELKYITVLFI